MKTSNRAKLVALNDMNRLNIPTYLLEAFNKRRIEEAIRRDK